MSALSHGRIFTQGDFTGTVTAFNSQGSTVTVAATDVARPADWNSAHNFYLTISGAAGNTLGSSTASGTNLVFGFTDGATGSMSTAAGAATLWIDGHRQETLYTYEPFPLYIMGTAGSSTANMGNATRGTASFFPFRIRQNVAAGYLNLALLASFTTVGTSSGRQSGGMSYGIYTRGTGTQSTRLVQYTGSSFSYAVTGNNSSYTLQHPTTTGTAGFSYGTGTNSSGVNISSGYTGNKLIWLPIGQSLSEDEYWLGLIGTQSTSSINVGLTFSIAGGAQNVWTNMAPLGSFSTAYSTGSNLLGRLGGAWHFGHASYTAANLTSLPVTVNITDLSAGPTMMPYMKFWSSQ